MPTPNERIGKLDDRVTAHATVIADHTVRITNLEEKDKTDAERQREDSNFRRDTWRLLGLAVFGALLTLIATLVATGGLGS